MVRFLTKRSVQKLVRRFSLSAIASPNGKTREHIPIKYSEAEVAAKVAPLSARIRELEAKLAEFTKSS
jgi:hypothetical protein